MSYLLLGVIVFVLLIEQILSKQYNLHAKRYNVILFTAVGCFFELLFFLFNGMGQLNFQKELFPYALALAVAFGLASVAVVLAIKTGPLSITMLVYSYSLLIPTFYGIFFLHEPVNNALFLGLLALAVALYLINRNKNESTKFHPMWIVYIFLAFLGNGMCSTVQKMQQIRFSGAYKNELMVVALVIVTLVLSVIGLCQKGNKTEMLKDCIRYAPLKGICNGIINFLVMTVSASLPNAVLFPSISAGSIVLTFICSMTIYHERLSKSQLVGYVLGVISVILLNI